MPDFLGEGERKVEYIELIFDLIFVHTISRCGSLLHLEEGVPDPSVYLTFLFFSVAVLEIWYYSTLFINRFPGHKIQRDVCIFVDMYLLYHLTEGIRADWGDYYHRIHVAWALILLHLAVQYGIALRHAEEREQYLCRDLHLLLIEAAVILLSIPVFDRTGLVLSPCALLVGVSAGVTGRKIRGRAVDFPHLTERVMLYVVFSFGEMIVGLAGFFEDGIHPLSICRSLLAFAFVSGLFLNYGYVYDHIIDRERQTSGDGYLFLHLFLILSLSYLTQVLEMLRAPLIPDRSKILSLAVWLIAYVLFLSSLERYAKVRACRNYYLRLILMSAAFIVLLIVTRRHPVANFSCTVLYIYGVHLSLRLFRQRKLAVSA